MAGQTVTVSVLADTKQFSKAFKGLSEQTGLSKIGGLVKNVGKAVAVGAAAAAAGVGALAVSGVRAASDLQQSIGGVDAVFKENAKQVHAWASSAAKDMGLSKDAYNTAATAIGTTLKNAGIPMEELGGRTNNLIGLAGDLSATFGGDVAGATAAMGSALRGEFEPLRAYGISLSQADINARALVDSGKANVDQLTKEEKALATQALMYEQSADAQGAFARESNTLAGQSERLKAGFENIKAQLGTYLLPVLTTVVAYLSDNMQPAFDALTAWVTNEGVPRFQEFAAFFTENIVPALQSFADYVTGTVIPGLQSFGGFLVENRDVLTALGVVVGTVVVGIGAYVKVMAIWKAATAAATAVQVLFSAALSANPIGLVILAIAALVAGLVYFFTKTDTGRKIVEKAWGGIKTAMTAVTDWWSNTALPALRGGWDAITGFFSSGVAKVKGFLNGALDVIKTVWSFSPLGLITTNFGAVLGFLQGIPGKVKGALAGAGEWLLSVGGDIIRGLVRGLERALDTVRNAAKKIANAVTGPVKKLLGIASPSKVLAQYGRWTTQGAAKGLADPRELRRVEASMKRVSGTITGGYRPALAQASFDAGVNPRGYAGSGNTYTITLNTLRAGPEEGRVIVKSIEEYERMNGPRR